MNDKKKRQPTSQKLLQLEEKLAARISSWEKIRTMGIWSAVFLFLTLPGLFLENHLWTATFFILSIFAHAVFEFRSRMWEKENKNIVEEYSKIYQDHIENDIQKTKNEAKGKLILINCENIN